MVPLLPVSKIITLGDEDFWGNKSIGPQMFIDICIFVGERSRLEIFDVASFKYFRQCCMKFEASILMMNRCS